MRGKRGAHPKAASLAEKDFRHFEEADSSPGSGKEVTGEPWLTPSRMWRRNSDLPAFLRDHRDGEGTVLGSRSRGH